MPQQQKILEQALSFHQAGKIQQAKMIYQEVLQTQPRNADVLGLLGTAECQLGNLGEGVKLLGRSLEIFPDQPKVYINQGAALLKLKRVTEALFCYDKALEIAPDFAEACYGRGNALRELERLEEALESYDKALAIHPKYAEAHNNRGNVLKDLRRLEEALASYDRALEIKPDYAEAHYNQGNALQKLRRLEEALACYDKALAIKPGFADVLRNKSMVKILEGDYSSGWNLYEWRWKCRDAGFTRPFEEPCWLGDKDISGKTLLIYPEQGLGDYLQFCRYASMAQDLGAKVVLETPQPLVSVISTLKGNFTIVQEGERLPAFDYQCPVMSLPLAFRTKVETIPAPIPYLFAEPEKTSTWQEILGPKTNPRIGLFWAGNSSNKNRANRGVPLTALATILNLPAEFHSLQKDIPQSDEERLIEFPKLNTHKGYSKDFPNTAALIEAMDLIISVDSSIAHLAGAMGKQVWILLPFMPDYRWMLDRSDSPWYPTARLFRQPGMGDWNGVIEEVSENLMDFMEQIETARA